MNNTVIFRAFYAFNSSFPSHLAWLSVVLLTNCIADHSCLIFRGSTNKLHLRAPLAAFCIVHISLLCISFKALSMTKCHHIHWLVLPVAVTYVCVGVDTSLSTWSLNWSNYLHQNVSNYLPLGMVYFLHLLLPLALRPSVGLELLNELLPLLSWLHISSAIFAPKQWYVLL
jgi:hypothetical protein